jgi:hypothetical protein
MGVNGLYGPDRRSGAAQGVVQPVHGVHTIHELARVAHSTVAFLTISSREAHFVGPIAGPRNRESRFGDRPL